MTDGSTTWNYTYDVNGLRTSATNGTAVYKYYYSDGKLVQKQHNSVYLYFIYDATGAPIMMKMNADTYYYVTNLQGDVIAMLDSSGNTVASYTYDAWGRVLTATGSLAIINPLRYRGYVYDHETGLYYLQSRYYNPELGRFLNADNYPTTGQGLTGNNMFAYCGNNPVIRVDDGGEFWNIVIGAVIGAAVSAVTTAIQTYKETGKIDVGKTVISAAVGAVSGGVAATGLGVVPQAVITASATFVGDVATQKVCEDKSWDEINYKKAVYNSFVAGTTSVIGSALGSITSAGHMATGEALISAGKDKLLTGYIRQNAGQSSSHMINQARKMALAGEKYINIGRGISSVTGTTLTWGVAVEYSWR